MKLKQKITVEDLLDYIGINYEGVKEALESSIDRTHTSDECLKDFEKYYSEYGLGDDDKWEECEYFLPILFEITKIDETIQRQRQLQDKIRYYRGQIELAKGNLDMLNKHDDSDYIYEKNGRVVLVGRAKLDNIAYIAQAEEAIKHLVGDLENETL